MNLCFVLSSFLFLLSLCFFWVSLVFINVTYFVEFSILSINSCSIVMTMYFDWMTYMFLSVVFFISFSVICYSNYYMMDDLNINRFILMVFLFVFSMILLIISPNLISILLGWDGLGLISYCLVIYYQNIKSFNSGLLTILMNRVGDVALLLSIAWLMNYGGWNYIFFLNFMSTSFNSSMILFFIMLACFTKSAQIPFSSWLPAAMAAPTPVSSLVHSSTLVTAGVYLLIRFKNLFFVNSSFIFWGMLFSVLTMFMSGLNANFETDLKKIIALSTLSQLGFMMSILFLGSFNLAFFHLLTHALFKALLFMCAGIIIHNFNNLQDIRLMGCVGKYSPFMGVCFMFANFSLCGFPFMVGFYSKDLILEMMLFINNYNILLMILIFFSTLLTICYTFRLIMFVILNNYNSLSMNFLNDNSWGLNLSLVGLMVMIIFGGSMISWIIIPTSKLIFLSIYLKILPLVMICLGSFMGYLLFFLKFSSKFKKMMFLKNVFSLMWFLPVVSNSAIKVSVQLSSSFNKMDQNWIEFSVSNKIVDLIKFKGCKIDLMFFNFNKLINLFVVLMFFWIFFII
uniref:NADH-ubiquinone oxidoreductase chain 5 n=1 Tax=Athalia arunachalensis TaxID=2950354 RepID=A0A977TL44_9HYME|nr:NADH dehydrogenase subunit 5 [Athalia arunachalensis]UXW93380.1 NADH dehydrogenase subunit 5 [Athalia arunachalensis]